MSYIWKGKDIKAQLSMTGDGWNKLHPEVQKRALAVIKDAAAQGLNVGIFEGWRDSARQQAVMNSGNSQVSNTLRSYHTWGLAVDFVFIDYAGWTWNPPHGMTDWQKLGKIIEANGFEWGGRWSGDNFDGPHAQYKGEGNTSQLLANYHVPSNVEWT